MTQPDQRSPAAGRGPAADDVVVRPADPEPWVVVEEKPGFDGFLTVRLRRYRLPDGREVDWDVFSPALNAGVRAGVTVLPLTPEGTIVTVRMFRAGPDVVVTNLPGGLIDPGEEPAAAGRRELEEETGYTCESIEVVGWQWEGASSVYRKYLAIARGCRPDGQQSLDEYEDCVPVELTVDQFRAELRTPGAMTGIDSAYATLDHAGLL
ncbi:MAG TPA: NUDIX hydrolase [Kribbella sp.]|uniref:NUDIX hydrolase n=1 Tax=Kribbella sp. TaxID=1871183 RepID=UPI002D76823A|nr:NUDIX hydrolase [Kribbella sp.]HET6299201.1 NUDIX hydrolase [Kribbella sp.]